MNFDALPATTTVEMGPPAWAFWWVLFAIVFFVVLIWLSAWVAYAKAPKLPAAWPRIVSMPPAARALVMLTFFVLLLVQAVAVIGVWYHTRVVHASAREYFEYLSVARLIGMSHAHLFGYAILYGLMGGVASLTHASERTKTLLVAMLLWSGVFDVASWWGIKLVSADFEWLSVATAVASAGASFVVLGLLAKSLKRSPT